MIHRNATQRAALRVRPVGRGQFRKTLVGARDVVPKSIYDAASVRWPDVDVRVRINGLPLDARRGVSPSMHDSSRLSTPVEDTRA